jgi:hypothetical protein
LRKESHSELRAASRPAQRAVPQPTLVETACR